MQNKISIPEYRMKNSTDRVYYKHDDNKMYTTPNIPLLIFDLILLPIHMIRMIFIYFWGSKYNLKGFQFLDVILHADNPYFNQEDCRIVDTIGRDYRVVIRDDSRIFPMDINQYFRFEKLNDSKNKDLYDEEQIIVGSISQNNNSIWDISTEDFEDDNDIKNNKKIKEMNNDNSESESSFDFDSDSDIESTEEDQDSLIQSVTNESIEDTDNNQNHKDIKGVNYFGDNDDNHVAENVNLSKKKGDILDSIRDELNSVFDT